MVRVSLGRYSRDAQLEEGYGIPLAALEKLARSAYGDDPCERFACKGESIRDPLLMARMQKAIAIIQFKVEGELFLRRTDWGLGERALLAAIDPAAGTVAIDGTTHPLLDAHLPTIDWANPHALTPGEAACLAALTESFTASNYLWKQMRFVASHGGCTCGAISADLPRLCARRRGGRVPRVPDRRHPCKGKALFDA